jgi:nitrogen fixation NifU-like protein
MSDIDEFADQLQAQILEELRGYYTEKVIRHWMHPKNFRPMERPDGQSDVTGECGDSMEMYVRVQEGRITEASYMTDGCGTSIACGSAVVTMVEGETLKEAWAIDGETVLEYLGGLPDEDQHCAYLAADALKAALKSYFDTRGASWKTAYKS